MRRRYSSELEALRWSIRPTAADVSQEDVAEIVDSVLAELPQSTAEDFMKSLGSIGTAGQLAATITQLGYALVGVVAA